MASKIREAFFSDKGLQGQIHKLVNPRDKLFEIDSVKKVCSSSHSSGRAAAAWLGVFGLDHRVVQSRILLAADVHLGGRIETTSDKQCQLHVVVLRARPNSRNTGMVCWCNNHADGSKPADCGVTACGPAALLHHHCTDLAKGPVSILPVITPTDHA